MTEAKHTPGPWKQHPDYPWIIKEDNAPISEDGVSICNTTSHPDSGFFPTPSESRANARLIAAAPELLEALQEAKAALEWCVEQGGGPTCEHESGCVVCFCKENKAINLADAAIAKAIGN